MSEYTLATGIPYTDQTLDECTVSRGRAERACRGASTRGTRTSCSAARTTTAASTTAALPRGAVGPIWLGYYRSENGGASFTSSLVPGYPDDTSPYAALSQVRTASCRRSRDRLGQPGPRVLRLRELGRSGRHDEDVRRRVRRTLREPGRTDGTRRTTASSTTARPSSRRARRRRTCSASSTTRRRSKPTAPAARATATSTSRGRASPATAASGSTSPARPTTA